MEFYQAMAQFVVETMQIKFNQMTQGLGQNSTGNETRVNQTTINKSILNTTVQLAPPIYGSPDINFRDFMHPSFLLLCAFFLSLAMTSLTMIQERMKGLLDRTLVAGAKLSEILAALIMVQAIVLLIQILGILAVTLVFFDFYNDGNFLIIYVSALLQGICGICVGNPSLVHHFVINFNN